MGVQVGCRSRNGNNSARAAPNQAIADAVRPINAAGRPARRRERALAQCATATVALAQAASLDDVHRSNSVVKITGVMDVSCDSDLAYAPTYAARSQLTVAISAHPSPRRATTRAQRQDDRSLVRRADMG